MSKVPKVRKPAARARLTATDLARLDEVPKLRDSAVRAVTTNASHLFVSARLHKEVVTFLFAEYQTCPATEEQIALEFWRVYRHVAEGHSILKFNFTLIDPTTTTEALRKIIRGD